MRVFILFLSFLCTATSSGIAQTFEQAGERALGMGGAFVAVANDSSATWWNPAGLATGPFVDLAIARAAGSADDQAPGSRSSLWSFSLGTPPVGVSYYRFRITDIRPNSPIEQPAANREDRGVGLGVRSLSVHQFGASVLQTLITGLTAGATVKYVRGTIRTLSSADPAATLTTIPGLLDAGEDVKDGDGSGAFDIDLGVLAVAGGIRAGATVRNLRAPAFEGMRLPRQVRVGGAFDGAAAGLQPFTVAIDADVARYATGTGDRRVVAVGAEEWLRDRRIGVRVGARFNTAGAQDRTATAGLSIAPRAGMFVDGHVAFGSDVAERGWGLAARVTF